MTRWTDAFLDGQRQIGDPEADEVIAALHASGETDAAERILRTLIRNDQPPPGELPESVRSYLFETRDLPPWADSKLILRGEHLFQRWGMQMGVLLFHKAMAEGYLAARFARVLSVTGALERDPQRRLLETGQLVFDAMAPGGLDRGGKGIATALRVRLMHAAMRRGILDRAANDPSIWPADMGQPISQEDMAFTLMGFSLLMLQGLRQLGAKITREDAEAYLHCWRVVGSFVGIDDTMNPDSLEDARGLLAAERRRQYTLTPEGLALEAAMLEMLEHMQPRALRHLPRQMIRYLIGRDYAEKLGIQRAPLPARIAFGAYIRLNRLGTRFVSVTRIANLAEPLNRALLHAMVGASRGGDREPFSVPESLRKTWRL